MDFPSALGIRDPSCRRPVTTTTTVAAAILVVSAASSVAGE